MASTLPTHRVVVFTVASCAVLLSSCSLPPKQAWRKIRTDGLVAYVSYELNTPRRSPHYKKPESPVLTTPATSGAAPGTTVLAQNTAPSTPTLMPLADPTLASNNEGKILAAHPVPSLPGFVRSPYTNPPRLVDVKGASPGATMVCPYTGRPFIVPNDVGTTNPGTMLAARETPAPTLVLTPTSPQSDAKKEVIPPSSAPAANIPAKSPELATITPTPAPVTPAPVTPAAPSAPHPKPVVANTPVVVPSTTPAVAPTPPQPAVVQEIPYGSPIAGRPGFVNSPFAAKHQLVDVTGLPAGMEVKCPYTGKLFRVPAAEMATSKTPDAPTVASPEKKK